jgi:hypothetical protein
MADQDPLAGRDDEAEARSDEVPERASDRPDLEAEGADRSDDSSVIEARIEEVKQKAREMAEGDRS